jgi:hypothetical protein
VLVDGRSRRARARARHVIAFDDDWRARAACVGHGQVMFASDAFARAVAVQLCRTCPSRQPVRAVRARAGRARAARRRHVGGHRARRPGRAQPSARSGRFESGAVGPHPARKCDSSLLAMVARSERDAARDDRCRPR